METLLTTVNKKIALKLKKIAKKREISTSHLLQEAINDLLEENEVSEKFIREMKNSQLRMKKGKIVSHKEFWNSMNV